RHAGGRRRRATRKAGRREIEAAPEEVNGTRFANEAGAKLLEYAVGLQQRTPEAVRPDRIVVCVASIEVKGNCILDFAGHSPDVHLDAEPLEARHDLTVELRHGHRGQGQALRRSLAGGNGEMVIDKVEVDAEGARGIGDRPTG